MSDFRARVGTAEAGFSHHAFFLEGGSEALAKHFFPFLEKEFGITQEGNPDVFEWHLDRLYLADAREVAQRSSRRPLSEGSRKIFFLGFSSMTREAAGVFLKMLEEPGEAIFFLVSPSREVLADTLRSRMAIIDGDDEFSEEANRFAREFLEASLKSRLTKLEPIEKGKNRRFLLEVIDGLERELVCASSEHKDAHALEAIVTARGYLRDTSSSVKLLGQYLALALPRSS